MNLTLKILDIEEVYVKFIMAVIISIATVGCGGTFFPQKPDAWENGRCYKRATATTCQRVTDTMDGKDWDFLKPAKSSPESPLGSRDRSGEDNAGFFPAKETHL
uniref:hypothetical protein n=1 Tax=Serratia marcescens TaxID=615 RepID=UPI001F4BFE9D|nr:hypothetical protein [Serratia marcescens]